METKNTISKNETLSTINNVSRETMPFFDISALVDRFNGGKEYKTIKDFSPEELALLTMPTKEVPLEEFPRYTRLKAIYSHIDRLARNLNEKAYLDFISDSTAFYTVKTNGHSFRKAETTTKTINVSRETLYKYDIVASGKCDNIYYNGVKICEAWQRKDGYRIYSLVPLNTDSIKNETKSSRKYGYITRILNCDKENAIQYLIGKFVN